MISAFFSLSVLDAAMQMNFALWGNEVVSFSIDLLRSVSFFSAVVAKFIAKWNIWLQSRRDKRRVSVLIACKKCQHVPKIGDEWDYQCEFGLSLFRRIVIEFGNLYIELIFKASSPFSIWLVVFVRLQTACDMKISSIFFHSRQSYYCYYFPW